MQLVIPGLADVPRIDVAGVAVYDVAPGARLEIHPLAPLPMDLPSWGPDLIHAGVAKDRVRLVFVDEKETELGWPLTVALSELLDEAGTAVVEYRLHVMFRFLEMGGILVVRAATDAAFAQGFEFVKPLITYARPDFTADGAPALAHVWAHL